MPQRAVNVNITDWKTGGTFSGGTVEFAPIAKSELTATFSFASKVIDRRLRVDLVAAYMTDWSVAAFEFIHGFSKGCYGQYCYKRYAAQLNHTQPCRKVSWRRLSWKQKARAIAMAEECGWYDDYYYGRA